MSDAASVLARNGPLWQSRAESRMTNRRTAARLVGMEGVRAGRAAEERVWVGLESARPALESDLPPTDLQTLMLTVARARAAAVTPARLLRRWREDRFVRPSTFEPRRVARVEASLWE